MLLPVLHVDHNNVKIQDNGLTQKTEGREDTSQSKLKNSVPAGTKQKVVEVP